MTRRTATIAACLAGVALVAGVWTLSRTRGLAYPPMKVPADNPVSNEKATLGRRLFYDRRISVNASLSCADCHRQAFAFSDPRPKSVGATGELTTRNAMTLTNVAYNGRYTWANDTLATLEQQAMVPLTSRHPLEMGVLENEAGVMARLRGDPQYAALFRGAFPQDAAPISLPNIVRAISTFVRTLVSFDSPYDQFLRGNNTALTDNARRGFELFRSPQFKCSRCHGGVNFRMTSGHRTSKDDESVAYHNTGLYNLGGDGAYPAVDRGLFDVTHNPEDMGRFKAPTLRNVAVTAPYMHDGSIATLEAVIEHYAAGGRVIDSGPDAGDGRRNPHKSPLVSGFVLTPADKRDLLAFLESLTDRTLMTNPAFADPFHE
ncbi:MAG TPA: MbnH family di-heme enzyme [Vicinamibacterales bacterium]|jgi:cytochrome c peroxidase|nr:MbnH family di-heme enzyme [Vicinamibacterales bacterium]